MRRIQFVVAAIVLTVSALEASGQPPTGPPPAGSPPPGQRPAATAPQPPGGQRRGAIQVMTLSSSAWPDGGIIPVKFTQAGDQVSPPLSWSNAPDSTVSFVLIARDLDAAVGNGTDDVLHWMLWNIPGASRSLPEAFPHGPQLPDGTRQISVSGPYYRGPGAPTAGPPHHYVFELYALDGTIDVPAVGQSPAQTCAAVLAAMAGNVRGKGVVLGLFKR
jgi:Raf kinase inhibitor-like YbhB/YbcL family protein